MHEGNPSNLGDLVDRSGSLSKTAFIEVGTGGKISRFTHANIDTMSAQFAGALQSANFLPGDTIALIARNSVAYLTAYLGIMRAGFVAVPISYRQTKDMIAHCLRDSDAKLILSDDVVSVPDLGIPNIPISKNMSQNVPGSDPAHVFKPIKNAPRDVAMILYTSGSTGLPKGVELSHESQLFALSVFEPLREFASQQIMSIAAPLYHMNGLSLSKLALLMNSTVVLFSSFNAQEVIQAIPKFNISWLTGIPTMYALMVEQPDILTKTDLSSVKKITLGSSPLTNNLIRLLQHHFPDAVYSNSYGTTEHGPSAFAPHPDGLPTPALSLGVTAPGVETRLIGGADKDFGVLEVRSPANMNGYRNLADVTAEQLVAGWYHTGDLFRKDHQGFHFFVGREDDMFICNGENLHPLDIEKTLEQHPAILQACVVAVEDPIRGATPVAFVTGDVSETEIDIQKFYRKNARAVECPRRIIFVDQLPLAGTNKIDRKTVGTWAREVEVQSKNQPVKS